MCFEEEDRFRVWGTSPNVCTPASVNLSKFFLRTNVCHAAYSESRAKEKPDLLFLFLQPLFTSLYTGSIPLECLETV